MTPPPSLTSGRLCSKGPTKQSTCRVERNAWAMCWARGVVLSLTLGDTAEHYRGRAHNMQFLCVQVWLGEIVLPRLTSLDFPL